MLRWIKKQHQQGVGVILVPLRILRAYLDARMGSPENLRPEDSPLLDGAAVVGKVFPVPRPNKDALWEVVDGEEELQC